MSLWLVLWLGVMVIAAAAALLLLVPVLVLLVLFEIYGHLTVLSAQYKSVSMTAWA